MSSNNKRRVSKTKHTQIQKKTTGQPIIYMNKITESDRKIKNPVSTRNKPSKHYSNCHNPCKSHKSQTPLNYTNHINLINPSTSSKNL